MSERGERRSMGENETAVHPPETCLHGAILGTCPVRCACGHSCNSHRTSGMCVRPDCDCTDFVAQGGEG